MKNFEEYLAKMSCAEHGNRMKEIFEWVGRTFPNLEPRIAWNQPMFTEHGTFIIGFSASKQHMSVAPEGAGMKRFSEDIAKAGYGQSAMLFRIKWSEEVNYPLLSKIIKFNCLEKAECNTFWRP